MAPAELAEGLDLLVADAVWACLAQADGEPGERLAQGLLAQKDHHEVARAAVLVLSREPICHPALEPLGRALVAVARTSWRAESHSPAGLAPLLRAWAADLEATASNCSAPTC